MKKASRMRRSLGLAAALLISLFLMATSQAQTGLAVFTGKFTLQKQVQWGKMVLQPGDYTIAIASSSMPTFALVKDKKGRPVARFVSAIDGGQPMAGDALLMREKEGQLRVHSLALASLGRTLVYDPVLAREALLETRVPHRVTVTLAKR